MRKVVDDEAEKQRTCNGSLVYIVAIHVFPQSIRTLWLSVDSYRV